MTRDTVMGDTPASRATSAMVGAELCLRVGFRVNQGSVFVSRAGGCTSLS
jgi:hypothetical protein